MSDWAIEIPERYRDVAERHQLDEETVRYFTGSLETSPRVEPPPALTRWQKIMLGWRAFRTSPRVVEKTPIVTTVLLEGGNIGQLYQMWHTRTAAGQNLWSMDRRQCCTVDVVELLLRFQPYQPMGNLGYMDWSRVDGCSNDQRYFASVRALSNTIGDVGKRLATCFGNRVSSEFDSHHPHHFTMRTT